MAAQSHFRAFRCFPARRTPRVARSRARGLGWDGALAHRAAPGGGRMIWHRLRFPILGVWLLTALLCVPLALHVTHGLSSSGFDNPRGAAAWADRMLRRLPVSPAGESSTMVQGLPAARVEGLWAKAARTAGVPAASAHVAALPGHPATVMVDVLPGAGPAAQTAARALRAALAYVPGARVRTVGLGSAGNAVVGAAMQTLRVAGYVALPALAVLLLLVFDSAVAALLPLLVAVVASMLALAAVDLLEPYLQLSIYLTNIVSFLALGVGIDYSLFLSARFRAGLRDGLPVKAAVDRAMRTAGRSVFYSALAVGVSMLSLLIPRTAYWSGLAVGGCVAVFAVLVATLTLLPALLSLLGTQSERGRIPRPAGLGGVWPRLAAALTARPVPVLLLGAAVLVVPALGATGLLVRSPANVARMLPRNSVVRLAVTRQQQDYGAGSIAPLPVVLSAPTAFTDAATWAEVDRVTAALRALGGVAAVASPAGGALSARSLAAAFSAPGGPPPALRAATAAPAVIALPVTSRYGPDSMQTAVLLRQEQRIVSGLPPGWRGGVGGPVALLASFNQLVAHTLPAVVGAVAAVALLVLFAASGSVWVAALAVAFDGLVALCTAGLLVVVVEHGLLGFEAGPLDSSITPLIFVILFGLSMDYEVILIHRMREYAAAGAPPREAARCGLAETGGMITGAGLIMVAVFSAMLLSPLQIMRTLAFGMSAAILLDTWIVRTCLVPASVVLLGRSAWWPSHVGPAQVESTRAEAAD